MIPNIVIVAQPSPELDLALDAVDEVRGRVLLFSHPSRAAEVLLSPSGLASASPVGAVLIEVGDPPTGIEDLVDGLRRAPDTALIPIVLWGPADACRRLDLQNGSRANSWAHTAPDSGATMMMLAQTIHYWAVVNRPPHTSPFSPTIGG